MESIKKNKILLSVFFLTCIAFAYVFFFNGSSTASDVIATVGDNGQPIGGDVLKVLAQVNSVKIDQTLFSNSAWKSLKDISVPLPTETPGKSDLFGVVGSR